MSEQPPRPYILVVDDEWRLAANIVRYLERRGWCAHAVANVEGAFQAIDVRAPDFAVVDLRLPGLSGIDFCRTVQRRFSALPVVVMSARVEAAERELLLSYGVLHILTKPFPLSELTYVIARRLNRPACPKNQIAVGTAEWERLRLLGIGGTG